MGGLVHRRDRNACVALFAASLVATLLVGGAPGARAEAGAETEVPACTSPDQNPSTCFGTNPGNLQMFEYVPQGLPQDAPLVVFMHGCLSQVSSYDQTTGWMKVADERKWAVVFPQQQITNNDNLCLNWTSEEDITRDSGEALSIVQMVRWMLATDHLDASRVYITGHSAGGYFTSVMLATYPDVFAAGAEVSGGPYRCRTYQPLYLAPPGAYVPPASLVTEFSARDECTQADIDRTPQQWGDLLRMGDSSYTGPKRPIMLWHGSVDATVKPKNFSELIEQWTDFDGIDLTPDRHEVLTGEAVVDQMDGRKTYTYTHDSYTDRKGNALVETYLIDGGDHPYPGSSDCPGPGQANVGICATEIIANWLSQFTTGRRR